MYSTTPIKYICINYAIVRAGGGGVKFLRGETAHTDSDEANQDYSMDL